MEEVKIETTPTTALVAVAPGKDPTIQHYADEVLRIQRYAEGLAVTDLESDKRATEDLTGVSILSKEIEAKQKEWLAPLKEHEKAIKDAFALLLEPLKATEKTLKGKILAHRQEQERIRAEQERINQLRIEAAKAEMELKGELAESINLVEVIPKIPTTVRTDWGSSSTTKIWKFEVIDFVLLPDRFKMENATLIGKVVRAGERSIPGVRIYSEETLRVTPKGER
jgi:hypothetical protein